MICLIKRREGREKLERHTYQSDVHISARRAISSSSVDGVRAYKLLEKNRERKVREKKKRREVPADKFVKRALPVDKTGSPI